MEHPKRACHVMLIAHLPSGYILGSFARRQWREMSGVVTAAMIGSVIPDVDMLYFHFIDGRHIHHHAYITHWPLFWAATGILSLSAARLLGWPRPALIGIFFAGAMLHMVLDTVASPISWLMPFDRHAFEFVAVPATYGNWVLSFVLHWTFGLELLICAWALWLVSARSAARIAAPQKGT
ncbi:metal-dependent hydrolase [Mesorhizobium abyssinicae]|uniref:Metal-dependent hydrolase n=1 Tax=Mesorhizobium abyssinicae TaxID=1209958 RepID=A0ABU5AX60_9HYPH|nr:metal-dependent hydrolase [Mesorhizobium abyssinicae]MDX8541920.1 metal-dependent hydrolase [Mesorhizobium abyssinicae]